MSTHSWSWTRKTSFLAATLVFAAFTLHENLQTTAELVEPEGSSVPNVGALQPMSVMEEDDGSDHERLKPVEVRNLEPPMNEESKVVQAVIQLLHALENEYADMGKEAQAERMRQVVHALQMVRPSEPEHFAPADPPHDAAGNAVTPGDMRPRPENSEDPLTRALNDAHHVMNIASDIIDRAENAGVTLPDEVYDAYKKATEAYSKLDESCGDEPAEECKQGLRTIFEAITIMERGIMSRAQQDPAVYQLIEDVKKGASNDDHRDDSHEDEPKPTDTNSSGSSL